MSSARISCRPVESAGCSDCEEIVEEGRLASDGDLRLGCVPRLVDCPGTRRELPYGNNGG